MRIMALAAALVLLGASVASAQQPTSQDTRFMAATGTSTSSSSTGGALSGKTASASGQSLAVPSAPTTSTSATAVPPQAQAPAVSGGQPANPVEVYITLSDGQKAQVFGTQLFAGSFAGTRPVDSPNYVVQSGDQVSINLYGAINNGGVQTVDAKGSVFIPGVGPVRLAGVPASELQATIARAVHGVYTGAVGIYATLAQGGTIGVFVTGNVVRPGRFLGGVNDNVLYFLSQAGGVDPVRGSFRTVTVTRRGQLVATYDLYDFLLQGHTQPIRFEDGDVVFVAPRGPMVGVSGLVRNAFAFEASPAEKSMSGAELLNMAKPEPIATSVSMHGFRHGAPQAAYYPLTDFQRIQLLDGDHIDFRSDAYAETMTVSLQGKIRGPSAFVLPKGAKLSQLLAMVPLQGTNVDPRFVHVQRAEVAAEQKRALDDALYNLQRQVLTATPASAAAAQLATAQAQLVNQFIQAALQVQPDGNIAIYNKNGFQDLTLQDGDTVVLPDRTDVVIVTGEVLNPGGLTHGNNLKIADYVDQAGGFAAHANKGKFVLRHLDGSAEVAGPNTRPAPGDEIVVMPKVANLTLQTIVDITQIMFQIALTASSVKNVSGL